MNLLPIVCPFCPLHCDDVVVDAGGGVNVNCALARQKFQSAMDPGSACRIGDSPATVDQVIAVATDLLASPAMPRCLVNAATLSQARQLALLQEDGRIDLRAEPSATQRAMQLAISRDGTIAATLGDVKQHADLVWIIGDVESSMPRLIERLGGGDKVLRSEGLSAASLAQLAHRQRGGDAIADEPLAEVATRIDRSRYVAIIIGSDAFETTEALATAELLVRLILQLNRPEPGGSRRAVLLSMDATHTLRSVIAWRSNQTLPPSTAAKSGRVTAELRIGDPLPWSARVRLQIGGCDPGLALAEAYAPVSVPGVHHEDAVIRGDGTVTLGLQQCSDATNGRARWQAFLPTHQGGTPGQTGTKTAQQD